MTTTSQRAVTCLSPLIPLRLNSRYRPTASQDVVTDADLATGPEWVAHWTSWSLCELLPTLSLNSLRRQGFSFLLYMTTLYIRYVSSRSTFHHAVKAALYVMGYAQCVWFISESVFPSTALLAGYNLLKRLVFSPIWFAVFLKATFPENGHHTYIGCMLMCLEAMLNKGTNGSTG